MLDLFLYRGLSPPRLLGLANPYQKGIFGEAPAPDFWLGTEAGAEQDQDNLHPLDSLEIIGAGPLFIYKRSHITLSFGF
jgi:hypothetical protein